jgi:putative aldouronate transport system substrate-binding protein
MIPSDLNNGCFLNYVKGEFDVVTSGVGVDIDDDASDGITVINTYDTEKYKEMAEKAYDWNQKGYFMPDSTTNTTTRQDLFRANTAFSYYGNQHPGTATQETMNSGKEIVSIPIGRSTISTSSVNFCQWVIPAQCENPKKALAVLNLLIVVSPQQVVINLQ